MVCLQMSRTDLRTLSLGSPIYVYIKTKYFTFSMSKPCFLAYEELFSENERMPRLVIMKSRCTRINKDQ